MEKLHIGQRVKVIKIKEEEVIKDYTKEEIDMVIGAEGTIKNIDPHYIYPYEVKFDSVDVENLDMTYWARDELSLIPSENTALSRAIDSIIYDIENEIYGTFEEIIEDLRNLKKIGR